MQHPALKNKPQSAVAAPTQHTKVISLTAVTTKLKSYYRPDEKFKYPQGYFPHFTRRCCFFFLQPDETAHCAPLAAAPERLAAAGAHLENDLCNSETYVRRVAERKKICKLMTGNQIRLDQRVVCRAKSRRHSNKDLPRKILTGARSRQASVRERVSPIFLV